MGLDSYLWKKTATDTWSPDGLMKYDVTVTSDGKPVEHVDPSKVCYVIEEVGYWRKANQIHNWFVQNVQNGVDDCGSYYVEKEKLKELLDVCKRVVDDPSLAESLLPSLRGFFFGGDEYDEWYMQQLKYTIELLEEILKREDRGVYYEYESSW